MPDASAKQESPFRAHEPTDLSVRAIAWFAVGLMFAGILVFFSITGFRRFLQTHENPGPTPSPYASHGVLPPAPRLQTSPQADLRTFREAERQETEGYGWLDRGKGTVRIPISRAMEIVLQRGLPHAVNPGGSARGGVRPQ